MQLHDLLDHLATAHPGAGAVFEVRGELDVDITSVVHDSRLVTRGSLFCCIPGDHVDGHDFAAAAVDAGAVACVVEREVAVAVPLVRVRSVREFVGPLCSAFHGEPSRAMRVLGVTGTNGKTTTTYLLESIAEAAGERAGVVGTVGARLARDEIPLRHTTPEATELQSLLTQLRDRGAQTVAMEVSSHALDQHRVDGTMFAAACFTNLSHDHLDYHRSVDAYFDAKSRLFTREFTAHAVVNVDDEHGRMLEKRARDAGLDVRTYGIDTDADVRALEVDLGVTSTAFELVLDGARGRVQSSLLGWFNVANALAAAATAASAGFGMDTIVTGLSRPVAVPGRMQRIDAGQDFTVLVDYAHTPDALASVLLAARALTAPGARLIVVFGCGGDRDRAKRPVMGEVASMQGDVAIVTSDNPRSEDPAAIVADILAGVPAGSSGVAIELDRRAAIRAAVRAASTGDVVVVAGKGHEQGQTAAGRTVPFDDRVVAREELEAVR